MTPAPVDHDARRVALTRVLLELAESRGMEGVSVRSVADRAGVAIGTVQHYFPTKDAMLLHAYRHVSAELGDRAERAAEGETTARGALRSVLLELLPLDERRAAALRVAVGFAARALHAPALMEELRAGLTELQAIVTAILAEAGATRPADDAAEILALTSGLADPLLFGDGTTTPASVVRILDAALERLVPG